MSDDFPPVDLDLDKKQTRRKKGPSVKKLQEEIDDLRQEREGLLERCQIAERAAWQNLCYAQSARTAIEDLFDKLMLKLNELHAPPHPQNPNHCVSCQGDRAPDTAGDAVRST